MAVYLALHPFILTWSYMQKVLCHQQMAQWQCFLYILYLKWIVTILLLTKEVNMHQCAKYESLETNEVCCVSNLLFYYTYPYPTSRRSTRTSPVGARLCRVMQDLANHTSPSILQGPNFTVGAGRHTDLLHISLNMLYNLTIKRWKNVIFYWSWSGIIKMIKEYADQYLLF